MTTQRPLSSVFILALAVSLALGGSACRELATDEPPGTDFPPGTGDLVPVTGQGSGAASLDAYEVVLIDNPTGAVTLTGETEADEMRWFVSKLAYGATAEQARQALDSTQVRFEARGDTLVVRVETPAETEQLQVSNLLQIGASYEMTHVVRRVRGGVRAAYLFGLLAVEQSDSLLVASHLGDCDLRSEGAVSVDVLVRAGGACRAVSLSGDVRALVPSTTSARLEATAPQGEVIFDGQTLGISEESPGRLAGHYGRGEGLLVLRAERGDVYVEEVERF